MVFFQVLREAVSILSYLAYLMNQTFPDRPNSPWLTQISRRFRLPCLNWDCSNVTIYICAKQAGQGNWTVFHKGHPSQVLSQEDFQITILKTIVTMQKPWESKTTGLYFMAICISLVCHILYQIYFMYQKYLNRISFGQEQKLIWKGAASRIVRNITWIMPLQRQINWP